MGKPDLMQKLLGRSEGSPANVAQRIAWIWQEIPVPVILGLEENLDGTILGLFGRLGQVCIAVEGGQHDDPSTADHLEASVWMALVAGGAVRPEDVHVLPRDPA